MAALSIAQHTAVNRLAAKLASVVTSQGIDETAREVGVRLPGVSKEKKVRELLLALLEDGRTRAAAARVLIMLTIEGHRRTVSGQAEMTHGDVDTIVTDMRLLELAPGELARSNWRRGLRQEAPKITPTQPPEHKPEPAESTRPATRRARRHDDALAYLMQLLNDNTAPQQRGRELEKIVLGILHAEKLEPSGGHIVNPGEEIDLAFILDGHHYLVECKWEAAPVGQPVVTLFSGKVARKAVGTFGVVLSMSGFTQTINATASTGEPLRCVGLTYAELIEVLDGRTTFADVVHRARTAASRHATFYRAPQSA